MVAALGHLDLPVAVVSGGWDLVVPSRAAVSLARSIPGAELTILPRAGHFVARDDPDALAGVIRRTASVRDPRPGGARPAPWPAVSPPPGGPGGGPRS